MGNAALRSLAALEEVSFEAVKGSVVAVDAHNWLYRYLTTTVKFTSETVYTTDAGEEVANLIGVVQGLPKFFEHTLTPVFVFDGGVTDLKDAEISQREAKRQTAIEQHEAAKERGDRVEAARLEARTQRLTDTIQKRPAACFVGWMFPLWRLLQKEKHRPRQWLQMALLISLGVKITTRSCSVPQGPCDNSPRKVTQR